MHVQAIHTPPLYIMTFVFGAEGETVGSIGPKLAVYKQNVPILDSVVFLYLWSTYTRHVQFAYNFLTGDPPTLGNIKLETCNSAH